MKVANGEEATGRIPATVEPIQVEVPLGIVPVEVRHVAVAIDLRDRAFVRIAIQTTAHRILSGLNLICYIVCSQRFSPTVSDF